MLEIIHSKGKDNFDFVQTCIFGLGVIAARSPNNFQLLPSILQAIDWVLTQNFKDDKGGFHTCTDNAVSTLGKCIYYHGNQIPAQIVDKFLSSLPLKTDTVEA